MDEETLWTWRGIYSAVVSTEQEVVFILADRRFTESRKRDLLRRLEHLVERIENMEVPSC